MALRENHRSSDDSDDEESSSENGHTQQLEALQSLIPNSTGTDERSILENTRDYLERIREETEEIEKEISQGSEKPSSSRGQGEDASTEPLILQVETEELMVGSFVIKMEWRKREGGAGHVQRVIEGLDVKIISVVVYQKNPDVMSSTAFVEVNRGTTITEEELQDLIIRAARRSGLLP